MMLHYFRLPRSWPLLLLLLGLAPDAKADCAFWSGTSSAVNFMIASPITIPFNLPSTGTVLASDRETPVSPPNVYCDPGTRYGVVNKISSGPPFGGFNYIYPTGVAGVGYQLIHDNDTGNYMGPFDIYSTDGGLSAFSVGTKLQLVQTGPIADGSFLPAGTRLADWQWGSIVPEYFVLSSRVDFVASACTWDAVPPVILPTVSTAAFAGRGTTAGETAFSITLHCPTGSVSNTLFVDLSAKMSNGFNNVIANNIKRRQGGAANVGIELLDANDQPVIFDGSRGTANASVSTGPAPSGDGTLSFFAHYYATGQVDSGTVEATATFTLSYN
ncbi:fimbrial protein [Frateuria sp.]|uniref:fimbrial protein n=1 Tax=Frateuria sp. TaxID=2211372 RepID=UPI002D80BE03|nr:fimbrial protein [Frateuria sp.]